MKPYILDNIVVVLADLALFYAAAKSESLAFKVVVLVLLAYKLFRFIYDCLGAWDEEG